MGPVRTLISSVLYPVMFLLAAFALAVFATTSWAATLRVGKRKPFKTIEAAVAAANNGDKIVVDRGVYRENVSFNTTIDRLQIIGRRAIWDGGRRTGEPVDEAHLAKDVDQQVEPAWIGIGSSGSC